MKKILCDVSEFEPVGDALRTVTGETKLYSVEEIVDTAAALLVKQVDWEQTDETAIDFIKNKPALGSLAEKNVVEKSNLISSIQVSLDKADSALQSETDPTVPAWAKASSKPSYTASEVGAAETNHSQAASTISAGTFAGEVVANASAQTPATSLLRNSKLVSTETTPATNGEICWMYE